MNLANPPAPDFARLMTHLYRGGAFGYYWSCSEARDEKGFAKQKRTTWFQASKPGYLPSDKGTHGAMNLYFGIHPTTTIPPTSSKGEAREPHQVRGQLKYIAALNCLFAEYDAKDFEGHKEELAWIIQEFAVPPSVIIDSGGGYHVYWLLRDTFHIQNDADRARADAIQKAWVPFVGSDDDAKDLTRVLRIPDTRNYKAAYAPNFPTVTVVLADFDTLYTLEELEAALPEPIREYQPKAEKEFTRPLRDSLVDAAKWLDLLAHWRCEDYRPDDGAWVGVGMALSELGNAGLQLWEDWSRGSSKYKSGHCADKWKTFKPGAGITLGSLFYWAKQDSPHAFEPEYEQPAPKKTREKVRKESPVVQDDPAPHVAPRGSAVIDRPLPYKVKAEEAVLGGLIDSEESFPEVYAFLKSEDFYQRKHQWIYDAMTALYARGCGFDVVTIADELEAMDCVVSESDLLDLMDIAPSKNVVHHAKIVSELAKVRRLIGAAQRIERLGYKAVSGDVDATLVEAEAILLDVTQEKSAGSGPRPLAELLPFSEQRLITMNKIGRSVGIQAVPSSLNELIGGWQPGKLYIPAGYPGDGKTSWMLANLKWAADQGEDVLIFPLEMTSDELIQKMIGEEGRIDSHLLQSGPVDAETLRKAQHAIAAMAKKTHLWIDDTSGLTWMDIRTRTKQVDLALRRMGRRLKIVGIDYIQRMRHMHRKGSSDAAAVAETMTELKNMAKDMGIPVIANSQFSRDGAKTKRKPILQDLRDSGGIEQEADVVIFVYYSDRNGSPDNPDLIVEKNRMGRTGVRTVHFNRAHNIWQDVGHQEEPRGYHNGNGQHHDEYGDF